MEYAQLRAFCALEALTNLTLGIVRQYSFSPYESLFFPYILS